MGKAHDQEKAPDGKHCAYILGMFEQRKGKASAPGYRIPEFFTVKDSCLAQPIEYAHVEDLPHDEQGSSQPQHPCTATQRPERAVAIHIAPTDKHRALDGFKAIEEFLYNIDRLANIRHHRTVAQSAKGLRS